MDTTNSGFNSMLKSATLIDSGYKEKTIQLLDTFLSKYNISSVAFNDKLVSIVQQLQRRRKEFNATRFFVLVVGPVKSGKSTLVNIFARQYVSPTAYRECTAIPTIIGKSSGEHFEKIVQYFPSEEYNSDKDKVETFDYIVDVIREVEKQDVLENRVRKVASVLTPEKVKETITLYHDTEEDIEQLVATIGIKGGGFIDDEIMLIDMPGLDGSKKHIENTLVYKSMAQRADVVFFVQSSTSALNKSSIDFLNELFADKRGQVPVWLIHNIHESQYFINDDDKKAAELREQIDLGSKRVQESFKISRFDQLALNLGKVYSALNEPERIRPINKDEVDATLEEYLAKESELITTLKKERQAIKDEINVGKSQDVINSSINIISHLIEDAKERKRKLESNIQEAIELEQLLNSVQISPSNFLTEYDALITKEHIANAWECAIQGLIKESYPIDGNKIKGKDLMKKIDLVRMEACKKMPIGVGTNFRTQLCESLYKEIYSALFQKLSEIETKFTSFLQTEDVKLTNKLRDIISEKLSSQAPDFTAYYSDVKPKNWTGIFAKKYDTAEQTEYLNLIKSSLIESIPSKFVEYRNIIKADFNAIRDEYITQLKAEIRQLATAYEKAQRAAISSIEAEIKTMQNMLKDLEY